MTIRLVEVDRSHIKEHPSVNWLLVGNLFTMSAPNSYEVLYSSISRGRADVIRLMLSLSEPEVKWSNNLIPSLSKMPAIKNEQRFGKVPRLTVRHADGTETHIWESRAIYDYVASELGFLPSNPLARADVNSLVFSLYEILDIIACNASIETVEARTAYLAKLRDIKIPEILGYHEKYLMEKESAGPYYGGQKHLAPPNGLQRAPK
ncbi:hypothetical protein BKA62DRAFT_101009 [Auriculariales sp. MPI-PUGE-AT-0066]|nr:hypothetical protein BKA62DRAFT_101009 [Auriculariales sp. MPI-PUGE-AT-0066]